MSHANLISSLYSARKAEHRLDQFVFLVLELMVWQGAEGDVRLPVPGREGPLILDIIWPHRHLLRCLLFIESLVTVYLACGRDSYPFTV